MTDTCCERKEVFLSKHPNTYPEAFGTPMFRGFANGYVLGVFLKYLCRTIRRNYFLPTAISLPFFCAVIRDIWHKIERKT